MMEKWPKESVTWVTGLELDVIWWYGTKKERVYSCTAHQGAVD
jgi:hypothetical protein